MRDAVQATNTCFGCGSSSSKLRRDPEIKRSPLCGHGRILDPTGESKRTDIRSVRSEQVKDQGEWMLVDWTMSSSVVQ